MGTKIFYSLIFVIFNYLLLNKIYLDKNLDFKKNTLIIFFVCVSFFLIKYLSIDFFIIPKQNFIFIYIFSFIPLILKMVNTIDKSFIQKVNVVFSKDFNSNKFIENQMKVFVLFLTIFQIILIWNPQIFDKI